MLLISAAGVSDGRAFHWRWVMNRGGALANVNMEQWMYRLPDGSVMIRTVVSKLGVIAVEVSEHFAHVPV